MHGKCLIDELMHEQTDKWTKTLQYTIHSVSEDITIYISQIFSRKLKFREKFISFKFV